MALAAFLLAGCGGGGGGSSSSTTGDGTQSGQATQTINMGLVSDLKVNENGTISATSSSGLPVTYESTTQGVCTIDATSGAVTVLKTGTCTIVISQPGNEQYAPAAPVTQNITVSAGLTQQTIGFAAAPALSLHGTATVSATASSGLSVTYSSTTPAVCTVNAATGAVTDLTEGTCTIAADQAGNATYAPAPQVAQSLTVVVSREQTITFDVEPTLTVGSSATVKATASSGLSVTYGSTTPTICSVIASTGAVTGIAEGTCTITADQAGNTDFDAAAQASLSFPVGASVQHKAPGQPTGVKAELSADGKSVIVTIGAADSGGDPIVSYTAVSSPAGLTATASGASITVSCPTSCAGYAFTAYASNSVGDGPASTPVDVITHYSVVETFLEPATQPNNSIFTGTFTLNSTKATVTNLQGNLTESMTTDGSNPDCVSISGCPGGYGKVPMTLVPLTYQLSATPAKVGDMDGLLVTSFYLSNTNTFTTLAGDGWSPASGVEVGGVYYGWPTAKNPYVGGVGNAYAMIFVNLANPTTALTQAQIDKLAYADCTKGGMMGAVCMTGTTIAGYGAIGTMGGYPISQVITKQ